MSDRIVTHRNLAVSAPESTWTALGWSVCIVGDSLVAGWSSSPRDGYLLRGIVETGSHDEQG